MVNSTTLREWGQLALALGIPLGVCFLGAGDGPSDTKRWYSTLNKPSLTPPDWVFPIVWTNLYLMMGYSSYRIFSKGGIREQALPLSLYAAQLIVNASFTRVFFANQNLKGGLAVCVALSGLVPATSVAFYLVDKPAGLLMLPYNAWGFFATYLAWRIVCLNPDKKA
eukprot:Platyproteum_vivax@DN1329_c0_g1_i1.p1